MVRNIIREMIQSGVWLISCKTPGKRNNGIILNYHSVTANDEPTPFWQGLSVRENLFRQQMAWLTRNRRVVDMRQFLREFDEGFPDKTPPLTITFDDGWRDNLLVAAPILAEHDLPATLFLTTGHVDNGKPFWWVALERVIRQAAKHGRTITVPLGDRSGTFTFSSHSQALNTYNFLVTHLVKSGPKAIGPIMESLGAGNIDEPRIVLSWEEVAKLEKMNWSFGPHTKNHVILSTVSREESAREIAESWKELCRHVKDPLPVFCYPNGEREDFTPFHVDEMKKLGMIAGLSMVSGQVTGQSDPFALPRIKVDGDFGMYSFKNLVSGNYRSLRTLFAGRRPC